MRPPLDNVLLSKLTSSSEIGTAVTTERARLFVSLPLSLLEDDSLPLVAYSSTWDAEKKKQLVKQIVDSSASPMTDYALPCGYESSGALPNYSKFKQFERHLMFSHGGMSPGVDRSSFASLAAMSKELPEISFPRPEVPRDLVELNSTGHSRLGLQPLLFSSCFESGNLASATLTSVSYSHGGGGFLEGGRNLQYTNSSTLEVSYDLLLENDTNSAAQHTQWYHFAARANIRTGSEEVPETTVKILATFNITNLRKRKSLYQMGMRPFTLHSGDTTTGWTNDRCTDVSYTQQATSADQSSAAGSGPTNYTLSFCYCFCGRGFDETVVFAMAPPLTYSALVSHLRMLRDEHLENDLWQEPLGTSLGGLPVPLLLISDFTPELSNFPVYLKSMASRRPLAPGSIRKLRSESEWSQYINATNQRIQRSPSLHSVMPSMQRKASLERAGVVRSDSDDQMMHTRPNAGQISHRSRPDSAAFAGGSHRARPAPAFQLHTGMVDFSRKIALWHRHLYCFHIVPMVNVDGVVHGNSRTTLAGVDPNRTWADPNPVIHPEVFKLKEYLKAAGQRVLVEARPHEASLSLIHTTDGTLHMGIHGHHISASEAATEAPRRDSTNVHLFLDLHGHSQKMDAFFYGCGAPSIACAVYPKLASRATDDICFESSRWKFSRAQLKTARSVAYRQFGVINSYTVECSFYASQSDVPPYVAEFDQTRLATIGAALGRAMAAYFQVPVDYRADPVVIGREWLHFEDLAGLSPQTVLDDLRAVASTVHDLTASLVGDEPTANSDSDDDETTKKAVAVTAPKAPNDRSKRFSGPRPRARSVVQPLSGAHLHNEGFKAVRGAARWSSLPSYLADKTGSGRNGLLQGPPGPALAKEQGMQSMRRRRRSTAESGPSGAMSLTNGIPSRKSYVAAVLSGVGVPSEGGSQPKARSSRRMARQISHRDPIGPEYDIAVGGRRRE
ncbi:hypothetical protein FOZ62_002907 [Perkinsus olseni]|uniref:Peptidase M14 domain-containing protein n=1 Tax=Perkinsus olseni TaxID=32597 RepID=A0A7J6QH57_PEROL|nr:hypothetical protein FOZ62_002907 [Perkinsus olseni]